MNATQKKTLATLADKMGVSEEAALSLALELLARQPVHVWADFGADFAEAWKRLDRENGGHNFVSLVDLRAALSGYSRTAFDSGLRQMRLDRRFSLAAAEGRHGINREQQEAGIVEDGTLLLWVIRIG